MKSLTSLFLVTVVLGCKPETRDVTVASDAGETRMIENPYLGQLPPGSEPVLFGPGVISTDSIEFNSIFSKDGSAFYFTRILNGLPTIMFTELVNEGWSAPTVASFSGKYADMDMAFHDHDQMMLFCSRRPSQVCHQGCADIWFVVKNKGGWSEPRRVSDPLNSEQEEWYPFFSAGNKMVFGSNRPGGIGGYDSYICTFTNSIVTNPENLGPQVNTPHNETDTFIAKDNSFLIVTSNRPGGLGKGDMYIQFRNRDSTWTEAQNLREPINSPYHDYCPVVSPDGKYFFFSRNGSIYWMDASVLYDLKPGA